jgi:uncharacterized membrane protein required for colicin V production
VDIVGAITSIKAVDILVFFAFFALFILGFMQGIIRRLLGIASMLISLLVGAQLWGPLGSFLASHWTQYSPEYNHMIAFGTIFVVGTLGSTVVLQLFYKPVPLFAKYPSVDEVLGGLLGLVQGALILAAFYLITDPFFTVSGASGQANEFPFIRQIHVALDNTVTADIVRHQFVPAVLFVFGALFPHEVVAVFRH